MNFQSFEVWCIAKILIATSGYTLKFVEYVVSAKIATT